MYEEYFSVDEASPVVDTFKLESRLYGLVVKFAHAAVHVGTIEMQCLEEIEAGAFEGCVNLAEVRFSDALQEIRSSAFCDTALDEVILPDSVTTIGSGVFFGCTSLEKITWPKNLEQLY